MQISRLFTFVAVTLLVGVVFAGLATVTATAETKLPEQWNKTFGGSGDDGAKAVYQTSDGGYVLAGYTSFGTDHHAYLVKTDASGNEQWNDTFGRGNSADFYAVQQTSDGGYILAG